MLDRFQKKLRLKQTDAEQLLWHYLRNRKFYGFKFRRQVILQGYIVDFVCLHQKLIIELDGSQHSDQTKYDKNRTNKLKRDGFRVIRFWNDEIFKDIESALGVIYETLYDYPSSGLRPPSPTGGEG